MNDDEQFTRFLSSANDSKNRSHNLHEISTVRSVCAAIKFLPLLAIRRTMHCFSLSSCIQMQSGRRSFAALPYLDRHTLKCQLIVSASQAR